jgi:hypothetical protein
MKKYNNYIKENVEKPAYSGILIQDNYKLLELVYHLDQSWEKIAHHVTLRMGSLPKELEKGKIVRLVATDIGEFGDKVIAVKVELDEDDNFQIPEDKTPHITLAVNRFNGGKPFISNKIEEWRPIQRIVLTGIISEFASDGRTI